MKLMRGGPEKQNNEWDEAKKFWEIWEELQSPAVWLSVDLEENISFHMRSLD